MRVFVSGEDGLLPSALLSWMRVQGYVVLNDLLPRSWQPPPDILQKVGAARPRASEVDVLDPGILDMLRGLSPTLIVHAAAMVGTDKCVLDERLAWRCNVETTFNMACLARDTGARLVYMSTGAVYDPSSSVPRPYSSILDWEYPPRPATIYGKTKYLGETICREIYGSDALIVRPGFVYGGVRDTSSTIIRLAKAVIHDYAEKIDVMLDFKRRKDFLHVDDYLGVMSGLVGRGVVGTFDIARGDPRPFGDGMRVLFRRYGDWNVLAHMNHQPGRDYLGDHYADPAIACGMSGYDPRITLERGLAGILNDLEEQA